MFARTFLRRRISSFRGVAAERGENPFLKDPRFAQMSQALARPNTFRNSDMLSESGRSQATGSSYGSGLSSSSQVANGTGGGAPISLFRSMLGDAEAFYFGKTKRCRLCGCLSFSPTEHINIGTHSAHEVLIDCLMPIAIRGDSVSDFISGWNAKLLQSPEIQRLPISRGMSFEQRLVHCRDVLFGLRQMGRLKTALMVDSDGRDVAFERVECIGDNTWGSKVAGRMILLFPHMHQHWFGGRLAGGFNVLRDVTEANLNLERVYNLLQLDTLLPTKLQDKKSKFRADVVEAILGELHIALWSLEPGSTSEAAFTDINGLGTGSASLFTVIQHALNELFDIIALSMLLEYSGRVLAILREAITVGRFFRMIPDCAKLRRRTPFRIKGKEVIQLPEQQLLHEVATPFVCRRDKRLFPDRLCLRSDVEDFSTKFLKIHCQSSTTQSTASHRHPCLTLAKGRETEPKGADLIVPTTVEKSQGDSSTSLDEALFQVRDGLGRSLGLIG
jgi:hypothetical protein